MVFFENLGPFIVFASIAAFTPGPNNIMLAASGANFGFTRSVPHILGIAAGFTSVVIAGGLGLGGLLAVFPVLKDVLRLLALGCLIYLAFRLGTSAPAQSGALKKDMKKSAKIPKPLGFWPACFFQWMNPKALIVVFSAITAYANAGPQFWSNLTIIALIFLLVTILSTLVWCWLGTLIANFLSSPKAFRIFNVSMALLLVGSLLPVLLTPQ